MPKYLYTIESVDAVAEGIALFPGVPHDQMEDEDKQATRQGTLIELRLPNGQCKQARIATFHIVCPTSPCEPSELAKLPIVLVIDSTPCTSPIAAGSEVWLVD